MFFENGLPVLVHFINYNFMAPPSQSHIMSVLNNNRLSKPELLFSLKQNLLELISYKVT